MADQLRTVQSIVSAAGWQLELLRASRIVEMLVFPLYFVFVLRQKGGVMRALTGVRSTTPLLRFRWLWWLLLVLAPLVAADLVLLTKGDVGRPDPTLVADVGAPVVVVVHGVVDREPDDDRHGEEVVQMKINAKEGQCRRE